jgi:adenine-specific DNA-methyltransferase
MNNKEKYGQYMTPKNMAEFMVSLLSKDKSSSVLEPCSGKGIFIESLLESGFMNITSYEIDSDLINKDYNVINQSYVSADINILFDLIIGNPPYIRWKNLENELKQELESNYLWNKYCNSLCDYLNIFIIKSIELLKDGGELIFITPEYWLTTTHSLNLRNYMVSKGYLDQLFLFGESKIFESASLSTIVFKFVKSNKEESSDIKIFKFKNHSKQNYQYFIDKLYSYDYFSIRQFIKNATWVIAPIKISDELFVFESQCCLIGSDEINKLGNVCHIGNGMVSGLDKAFQVNYTLNEFENSNTIRVIKAKNLSSYYSYVTTKYLFIKERINDCDIFEEVAPNFSRCLKSSIEKLNRRYNYNKVLNYWEWSFLRNFNMFSIDTLKIFVPCKERVSNKTRLRFSLVDMGVYPTQDVTCLIMKGNINENIYYINGFLQISQVYNWFYYKGTKKGEIIEFCEKPISNLPFKKINFDNLYETNLYNLIVKNVKDIV